jgi:flagellar biosynthetic protein FliR
MPVNLTFSTGTLMGFLLVLARAGGALTFVPLPGFRSAPQVARVALAIGFTMALAPIWPVMDMTSLTASRVTGWIAAEATLGIMIGLGVAVVLEAFSLAAQILGLQAGYAYASTIDPSSEADSGVLMVLAQLMAGMLFFTVGLDREVLRLFAFSLQHIPAGTFLAGPAAASSIIHLMASLFSVAVRLALPVVALLLMVDVSLALLGRINQQLQLLSLAFPLKMLVGLLVLSWILVSFPRILAEFSGRAWLSLHQAIGS